MVVEPGRHRPNKYSDPDRDDDFDPGSVTVELTPDVALSNATQAPGAANVPVSEPFIINLYGQQPVTWTALTVTASGTGNTAGITSLQVYLDNDYSGTVDAGDTLLGAGTFSGSTATIPLSYILSPDGFGSFLVVANFSSSAVTGTYAFNITGMTGSSNLPVAFTGLPFAGVTITIPGPTPTVTNTRTISSTPTSTLTSTITLTATVTNTPSGTWYATPWTNTPIPPNSYTPTPIFTYTPTPGWFNVALGPNSPTFNNPLLVGTSNLPVIQVVLRNDSGYSATLTGLTFTDTGSGTPSSGIDSFQLYNDLNGNGIVDNGEPLLGAASFTGSTATFSFTQNLAAATGSVTLLAVAEFASTGSTGTYTFSVTGGSGFNGLGGPEGFSNLPATGAPITITYREVRVELDALEIWCASSTAASRPRRLLERRHRHLCLLPLKRRHNQVPRLRLPPPRCHARRRWRVSPGGRSEWESEATP